MFPRGEQLRAKELACETMFCSAEASEFLDFGEGSCLCPPGTLIELLAAALSTTSKYFEVRLRLLVLVSTIELSDFPIDW